MHFEHAVPGPSRRAALLLSFLLGMAATSSYAAVEGPQKPIFQESYNGGFKDAYLAESERLRTLLPAAQQDIMAQLGLMQSGQIFIHPVTIRFVDSAPAHPSEPFFYVQAGPPDKPYSQELLVNVEEFSDKQRALKDDDHALRNALYFSVSQLILNDLAGGDESKALPLWAQEGLSVFVSGMGPDFVRRAAENTPRSRVREVMDDLDHIPSVLRKRHDANYFLAIQYVVDTSGIDTLQQFVRQLVGGRSAADATRDVLSQEWPVFEKNVRDYSEKALQAVAPADDDPRFKNASPARNPD